MLRIRNVVTCALAKVVGPPRHMKRRQVSAFGNDKNHIKIIFITSFVLIWKRDWDRDRDGDGDGSGEGKRETKLEGERGRQRRGWPKCFTDRRQYLQLSKYFLQANDFIHQASQATQRDNRVELPKVGRAGRFIRVLFYASSSCCCSINLWHEVTASSVSQSYSQSVSQSIGRHKHALKANGANTNKQIIKISLIMTADSVVAATTTTPTTRERIYWKLIKPDGSHNSFVCGLLIVYLLLKALPEFVFESAAVVVSVSVSQSLAVSVSQSLSVATFVSVFHLPYSLPTVACSGSNNELSSCLRQPVCIDFSISSLKVHLPPSSL